MKIILPIAIMLTLSSCAFFSKKPDNSAAINRYENKMRSIASSGNGQLQLSPGHKIYKADLTVFGSEGDVILFYKNGNEIVIKECDFYESQFPMDKRGKCRRKGSLRRVPVADFKGRLKSALRINKFETFGASQSEQLENYRKGVRHSPSVEVLVKEREKVNELVEQFKSFMRWSSKENLGKDKLAKFEVLSGQLKDLDLKLSNGAELLEVVDNLNKVIDSLIDDLIGKSTMNKLSYAHDKEGIKYSLLRSYLHPYLDLSKIPYENVTPGTFMMGSPTSEKKRHGDEARHEVHITKDFEIGVYEVTQFEWFDLMGYNPSFHKKESHCPDAYFVKDGVSLCLTFPVETVSYIDVQKFITERNKRADSEGESYLYRLPTEAEWELAARAGTQTVYSFGDNVSDLSNYAWYSQNSNEQVQAIGTRAPNPIGLFDVHGNVSEWVEDLYIRGYQNLKFEDPVNCPSDDFKKLAPHMGNECDNSYYRPYRVLRGRNWGSVRAYEFRSARRGYALPKTADSGVGFRLVRVPK